MDNAAPAAPALNPVRSIIAVLGGIGLISLVTEVLEFTLVRAVAGGPMADMTAYFAVRNRPAILAAKLAYTPLAAVLGGYMTAKVAAGRELPHAVVAATVQTMALIWGVTAGAYAPFTPVWMRAALVLLTGPGMVAGGAIRARAAAAGGAPPMTTHTQP
ncbi:MAG: hypothetical protein A3F70_10605 [Acidobacteria bacterium RIFCSPLOWO2_12_FULL_67_14]|nr:MAG: hypothetical protein A3F70_10605 [Acidobacteria bacterium RIFCSPLOWO2_12_FULL_67_14]